MRGAGLEPGGRVLRGDAAAELESAGISGEGVAGRLGVPGPELDDVTSAQTVRGIAGREPRGGPVADEVRFQRLRGRIESAADDLFHAAFVKSMQGRNRARRGIGESKR